MHLTAWIPLLVVAVFVVGTAGEKDENPASIVKSVQKDASSPVSGGEPGAREKDENPASIVKSDQKDASSPVSGGDPGAREKDENPASIVKSVQEDANSPISGKNPDAREKEKNPASIIESVQKDAVSPPRLSAKVTVNPVQRMDGRWNFAFPPVAFTLTMTKGRLFIDGQRIYAVPAQNGYVAFYRKGLDFYVNFQTKPKIAVKAQDHINQREIDGTVIEVKEAIPSEILQRISALYGYYRVKFEYMATPYTLFFSYGQVSVNSQPVKLYPSTNPQFPQRIGWVKWSSGIPDTPYGYLKVLGEYNIQFAVIFYGYVHVGAAYKIYQGVKDEDPDSIIKSILADVTSPKAFSDGIATPSKKDEHSGSITEPVQADPMSPLRKNDGIPTGILNRVAELFETWTFDFQPMSPFQIKFAGGKLSSFGHPVYLKRSNKPFMSTETGWVKLHVGSMDFYLRFNPDHVQYAAYDERGKQKHGTLSKVRGKVGAFSPMGAVPLNARPANSVSTAQRMDGTWDFDFHPRALFRLTMKNGRLSIYGRRIYSVPFEKGYVKFIYRGINFYVNFQSTPAIHVIAYDPTNRFQLYGTVNEVRGAIPSHILRRISAVYGYYGVTFERQVLPYTLYFYIGQVSVNGRPVILSRSSDRRFPEDIGWVKWSYDSYLPAAPYGYLKVLDANNIQFAVISHNRLDVGVADRIYQQASPMKAPLSNKGPANTLMTQSKMRKPMPMTKPGAPPANAFMTQSKVGKPMPMTKPGVPPANAFMTQSKVGKPMLKPGLPPANAFMTQSKIGKAMLKPGAPPANALNTMQRMDGTWDFTFAPVFFRLKMSSGRLYINGQRIRPIPYNNKMVKFSYGMLTFYVNFNSSPRITVFAFHYDNLNLPAIGTVTEVKGIPAHIIQRISALYGSYRVPFQNLHQTFYLLFNRGQLTVNGQPVVLSRSSNRRFPERIGWVKWSYDTQLPAPYGYLKVLGANDVQFGLILIDHEHVGRAYKIYKDSEKVSEEEPEPKAKEA